PGAGVVAHAVDALALEAGHVGNVLRVGDAEVPGHGLVPGALHAPVDHALVAFLEDVLGEGAFGAALVPGILEGGGEVLAHADGAVLAALAVDDAHAAVHRVDVVPLEVQHLVHAQA